MVVIIDGNSLTPQDVVAVGHDGVRVEISREALHRVEEGRGVVDDVIRDERVVYGINTGFGLFSQVNISPDELRKLQFNLIRSHASGTGDYITLDQSRMLLVLRINTLSKGHSGIRRVTLEKLVAALNANCIPCVPLKGTVGASGDLAPLAHLAMGLIGEGEMWDTQVHPPRPASAAEILERAELTPISLEPKEGLALINGTQFMTALGCEALVRAENVCKQADVVAAMSLEALKGTVRAYDPRIHSVRPHNGQNIVAGRMRHLLHRDGHESEISMSHHDCGKVQDAYTLRCIPQVHGIANDTLQFVRGILTTECNSATDNPMIFHANWDATSEKDDIVSGGNFHGEYVAKAVDYLAIGIHEIANISERRIERMTNPDLSGHPAFLVKHGGLNSGFMIPQCTAAALVSENKVLCHPSSVDSLSTSGAKEDHVSMGGFAARKCLDVVSNVEVVISIELMCAAQAIDLLRPLTSTSCIERVHDLVRRHVEPLEEDRYLKPDIDSIIHLIKTNQVWEAVEPHIPPEFCTLDNYALRPGKEAM